MTDEVCPIKGDQDDHDEIWLEPSCRLGSCRDDERTWCQDDIYDRCHDCDRPATKYIRADLYAAAIARAEKAEADIAALIHENARLKDSETYWLNGALEATAEVLEQARLNGMGSEREAKLLAERDTALRRIAELEAEVDRLGDFER